MSKPPRPLLIAIAFVAFVSLGLPDAILGVAWPSIRRTFDLSLSRLGDLIATSRVGYLLSSALSGSIVARTGVGRLLLGSSVLVTLSLALYATAPAWWVMVACGVLAGLGAGAIDAGINTSAAEKFPPRLVTWLHAYARPPRPRVRRARDWLSGLGGVPRRRCPRGHRRTPREGVRARDHRPLPALRRARPLPAPRAHPAHAPTALAGRAHSPRSRTPDLRGGGV